MWSKVCRYSWKNILNRSNSNVSLTDTNTNVHNLKIVYSIAHTTTNIIYVYRDLWFDLGNNWSKLIIIKWKSNSIHAIVYHMHYTQIGIDYCYKTIINCI